MYVLCALNYMYMFKIRNYIWKVALSEPKIMILLEAESIGMALYGFIPKRKGIQNVRFVSSQRSLGNEK